jgi:hypothetical protein
MKKMKSRSEVTGIPGGGGEEESFQPWLGEMPDPGAEPIDGCGEGDSHEKASSSWGRREADHP